jgi:uncharacterized membrane protein YeaQ/YmgE (transglycosylase-associated protein family)
MGFFYWILFGISFGILAFLLDSQKRNGGIIGRVILSVTGVLLALFMANLIFNVQSGFNITTIVIAMYGALMFLLTGRGLRRL